ncbi:MAG: hypothetical protein WCV67_01115 [Victivallaceae bacterium]|jgi:hypothetical protein
MKKNWKWNPFVQHARAAAQAVVDDENGACVEVIPVCGCRLGDKLKTGEVYAEIPGQGTQRLDHYLFRRILVNEMEYDGNLNYWRIEFLFDMRRDNYIAAEFIQFSMRKMLVKLTACNQTDETAKWMFSFLIAPNRLLEAVKLNSRQLLLPENIKFGFAGDKEWFNSPPLSTSSGPGGMLFDWGPLRQGSREFINFFDEWVVPPGRTESRWVALGDVENDFVTSNTAVLKEYFDNKKRRYSPPLSPQANDPFKAGIIHLANQLKVNRCYPPSVKYRGMPAAIFTPTPTMDMEYFWDAGFTAAGLAVFSPELAEECIAQYLPLQENTIFPHVEGAKVLIQVLAAWELYQQTVDKQILARLYPGLHEVLLYASGRKPWPENPDLQLDFDGIMTPPGGGSGLDDSPSQVWTRGYEVDWARQNCYWQKHIAVNHSGKLISTASSNMTAFVILSAKLLKQICGVLEQEVPPVYDEIIGKSESALQKYSWQPQTGHFHWVENATKEPVPYYDLSGLCPLTSGSYADEEQKNIMLEKLSGVYMTGHGLTTLDRNAPFFRTGYYCGTIWLAFHWTFWKSLLDCGKLDEAAVLANSILNTYAANYREAPICYELFELESGRGWGNFHFSGLGSIIVNLWAAYRKPGTVSFGFFATPHKIAVAGDLGSAEITVSTQPGAGCTIILRPDTDYQVSMDNKSLTLKSDQYGMINFMLPKAGKVSIAIAG